MRGKSKSDTYEERKKADIPHHSQVTRKKGTRSEKMGDLFTDRLLQLLRPHDESSRERIFFGKWVSNIHCTMKNERPRETMKYSYYSRFILQKTRERRLCAKLCKYVCLYLLLHFLHLFYIHCSRYTYRHRIVAPNYHQGSQTTWSRPDCQRGLGIILSPISSM